MSQPILSIAEGEKSGNTKATVNLLPCRIDHDGPVESIDSFWAPAKEEDGTNVVYFRGRKLQGKAVALPEKYRGVMLEREAKPENRGIPEESMDVVTIEDNDEIERQTFRTTAEFDEVMVWGHETIADATGDPYVRSVEEWLTVADQIHSYPEKDAKAAS